MGQDTGTTATLKRVSPGWAWIRETFTPRVTVLVIGFILSVGAGWGVLMARIASLEKTVATLAEKVDQLPTRDTNVAVMQERLTGMRNELDEVKRWKEKVQDKADEIKVPRVRKR